MLFLLVTSISFFLFLNSLNLKQLPSWTTNVRFLPLCFWKNLPFSPTCKTMKITISTSFQALHSASPLKQVKPSSKMGNTEGYNSQISSVLDLPELPLECILEKLSPLGLFTMAGVCSALRERCTSDHLWEKHMNLKWSNVIGPAAYREWKWYVATKNDNRVFEKKGTSSSLVTFVSNLLHLSKVDKETVTVTVNHPVVNSVMSLYLSLESGKFWFPAQVYNRENGHVGFMLSCYDAELSYDARTDTFQARYPPHGRKTVAIEIGVQWERLRTAPVDTPPYDLHFSDCLSDLHPGDHIEIQWRRNKEFPYGWWYGVVGHLESCDGNENYCRCHSCDTVVLEFNQYTPGSRWRRTMVNRKDHREKGNETDGYYGGIRKLYKKEEIATWKRLWPREILE